jgi:hypothetical protein
MAATPIPAATDHLPFFISTPGQTDGLLVAMAIFLLLAFLSFGVLYFRLHALPEHLAHGASKVQFQIVCVLALLAMFTHNNAFWIAGLLLALVPLPNYLAPIVSISNSLKRMAAASGAEPTGNEVTAIGSISDSLKRIAGDPAPTIDAMPGDTSSQIPQSQVITLSQTNVKRSPPNAPD